MKNLIVGLLALFLATPVFAQMGSQTGAYGSVGAGGSGSSTATNITGLATNQVAVIATNVVLGMTPALGNAAAPLTMTNATVTSWSTNTLVVTATGVTNNSTTNNFLVSVTAGTGLAVKDSNGTQFLTPVLNNTFPLKPGQRFTGTAVTAIAVQDP